MSKPFPEHLNELSEGDKYRRGMRWKRGKKNREQYVTIVEKKKSYVTIDTLWESDETIQKRLLRDSLTQTRLEYAPVIIIY